MKSTRFLAALAATAIALAACGGGGGSHSVVPTTTQPGSSVPAGSKPGPAPFDYGSPIMQKATLIKPIKHGAMNMEVLVNMQNPQGLEQYAQDVSNPKSPNYRKFLTPAQIAERFGATQSDYSAAAQYFQKAGLNVGGWPQRETLVVSGRIKAFDKAFGVTFGRYRVNGKKQTFIAPIGTPHLAANVPVAAVKGLITMNLAKRMIVHPANAELSGNSPEQMARAFDFTGAYQAGFDGTGVNVAIVGTGPILAGDAAQFAQMFNLTKMAPITQVDVNANDLTGDPLPNPGLNEGYDGFSSPPPTTNSASAYCDPVTRGNSPYQLCNPEDGEAQLDTQTIASLAPGANVDFYLGYWDYDYCTASSSSYSSSSSSSSSSSEYGYTPQNRYNSCYRASEGISIADAEIQEIIAKDQDDVVSISYGGGEEDNVGYSFNQNGIGYGPTEFATLATEGIATFVSSGDSGQYNCNLVEGVFCPSYPASDPSVTAVGGVTAPLNPNGTLAEGIWAWGDQTFGGTAVGSGGGVSQIFPAPSWQANSNLGLGGGMRVVPDIAMMGDPESGMTIVQNSEWGNDGVNGNSGIEDIGGTSMAAPQMAAMWALVLEACSKDAACKASGTTNPVTGMTRLGNAAPYLYSIYDNKTQYASTMFDVLYGDVTLNGYSACSGYGNGICTPPPGAQAMTGYDEMTGVGVPFAGHLIDAVVTNQGGVNPNAP